MILGEHFAELRRDALGQEDGNAGANADELDMFNAAQAFEQGWGKTPIPMREGGSIPIVALFEQVLGLKTVLLGFGLDSDSIHSPNEHYGIFNYLKGIETIALFHANFGQMMAKK